MPKNELYGNKKESLVKKAIVYLLMISLVIGAFVPYVSADGDGDPDDPEDPVDPEYPEDPIDPESPEDPDDPEDPEEPKRPNSHINTVGNNNIEYGNAIPVAISKGSYYGVIEEEIDFDGSESFDIDGTIVHYGWSFGDGEILFGDKVKHAYKIGGSFLVELSVVDNLGAMDTDQTIAFITVPNRPPSALMISGPENGSRNTKYSYAFGSEDLDNDKIKYIIDWGDGDINESDFLPSGHHFSMIHSWTSAGEFIITVTASDNQSMSLAKMTVIIEENIITDNIAIVILGVLALLALIIAMMYNKKTKRKN